MWDCPNCGSPNPEQAVFCAQCGDRAPRTCSRCHAQVPEGARFCPSCGHPLIEEPPRFDERKLVTVLFADVTGSTALGERLDPERLKVILAEYFQTVSDVIVSWGGTVEKFVGDAVMATFGVPVVRENDAVRALHAALQILERMEILNERFATLHDVRLTLRVGVNTGDVIAPLGERVDQLIVAGDAVNVAARLEAAAEPGTILVGERTVSASKHAFRFADQLLLELKGKSEAVAARRLLGPRHGLDERSGRVAPLVGRQGELAVLARLLDDVATLAVPRMAIMYGPAGIGKTRLTTEFVSNAEGRPTPPTVLRGRCLAVGTGITYWALSEMLRQHCGIGLGDNAASAKAKLEDCLRDALATLELAPAEINETVAALAVTAGIGTDDPSIRSLEPKSVAEALGRAWPRFLTAIAAAGPTLVVIEDLHWAGDQLVELLGRTLVRSEGPLLFTATARPEFSPRGAMLGGGEGLTTIHLSPLNLDESRLLVSELLPERRIPERLQAAILDRAEGNPFFLEEIVERLVEDGTLSATPEGDDPDPPVTTTLPDSINSLLSARIDDLTPNDKVVLQEAAVVGRTFWSSPVRLRLPGIEVAESLLALESRGLITAKPSSTMPGETEYTFRHALVRDVAYSSLPHSRRAMAHATVAEWTEQLAADRREEYIELVAHHYWMAVAGVEAELAWVDDREQRQRLRSRAFDTLIEAGSVARRRYALSRAVELHERALELAEQPAQRLIALKAIGDDHSASYHGDETVKTYARALEIARSDPGLAEQIPSLTVALARESVMKSGTFKVWVQPDQVEDWISEGLESSPDIKARTWLLALQGDISQLWNSADLPDPKPMEERIAAAEEGRQCARQVGHPGLQAYTTEVLMQLYEANRRYEDARQIAEDRLHLVGELTAPSTKVALLFESAHALGEIAGDWRQCEELARRAHEIAVNLSPHELMHATGTLLEALFFLGRWAEAEEVLEEHLTAHAHESDVSCAMVRNGPVLGALLHAYRDDADRARHLLSLAPVTWRRNGHADGCRALVQVTIGDVDEGLANARAILAHPHMRHPFFAHAAVLEALAARGRLDDLGKALDEARPAAAGSLGLAIAVERFAAHLAGAAGDGEQAGIHLRSAIALADGHGMAFEAARARLALSNMVDSDHGAELRREAATSLEAMGAAATTPGR